MANSFSLDNEAVTKIDKSIDFLKGKVWERFQDRLQKVEVFGSYDRGTALPQSIDKNSDVDILLIFKTNDFQPQTFLNHLRELAEKLYPRSDVSPDHPAITIELDHIKFELVPAYWEENIIFDDELKIPAPRNKDLKWITTDPVNLKTDLIKKNEKENQLIVPLIKIIKYFNTLNDKPYDSFAIEKFAINRIYPG